MGQMPRRMISLSTGVDSSNLDGNWSKRQRLPVDLIQPLMNEVDEPGEGRCYKSGERNLFGRSLHIDSRTVKFKNSVGSIKIIIHYSGTSAHEKGDGTLGSSLAFRSSQRGPSDCSRELLDKGLKNQVEFFVRLITLDETWVYCYELKTKLQSKQ